MSAEINTTERKGPWFVVNMRTRWQAGKIDRGTKPTVVHDTLASAFAEAARLAALTTRGQYAVFECIGFCSPTAQQAKRVRAERAVEVG